MFRFERLDVWGKAIAFASAVYDLTKAFPSDERFGLTSQLRRAAVSISANIAEGSGRTSPRDNRRFIEIAYASLMEVVSCGRIAQDQAYLSVDAYNNLKLDAERIARMLSGLRTSLQKREDDQGRKLSP